jgi:protein-disulfide isomerase
MSDSLPSVTVGSVTGAWKTVSVVIAVAGALAAAAIGYSATRSDMGSPKPTVASLSATSPFAGIRQNGIVLGSPSAPVTLVEFADLQCPYCAAFARNALPAIVRDYVRTGRVRIVFEGLAFIGPDSTKALRAVLAASLQNRAWDVLDRLYAIQGAENGGWVTNAVLRDVARGVPGLDVPQLFRHLKSGAVESQLDVAAREARSAGVRGTPSFFVGPTGGTLRPVGLTSLTADALRPALEAALAR